jgi:23S rRNA (guanine2445-N2)-methyltransferase / 23S rRNA (guanine2069-N7)-methyltransferase
VVSSHQRGQRFIFSQLAGQTEIPDEGRAFANRLLKNMRKLSKWAKKEGVFCYRIYDRDMPEYNICLDIYDGWLHVQEFAPPSSVEKEVASRRLNTMLAVIRKVFDVKREQIFIKTRYRQKGRRQYEKKAGKGRLLEVREGDCRFLVNLTDYIDTGLFLDHRPLREKIAKEIKGKRFLNLFGYTGTATVCAAKGGAAFTTTVDLSNTYLHWCRLNLSLNGFSGIKHEVVKDDCVEWILKTTKRFDLIFLDPPTFSNTKKTGRTFDIQRDHSKLITLAMDRLDDNGLLLFSTNFRKFILDRSLFDSFEIVETTDQTIPFDFQRPPKIHRCWEIRKRGLQDA